MKSKMATFGGPGLPEGKVCFIRKITERDAVGNPTRLGGEVAVKPGEKHDSNEIWNFEIYVEARQATLDVEVPKSVRDEEYPAVAAVLPKDPVKK